MPTPLFLACFAITTYGLISLYLYQLIKQKVSATPKWLAILYVTAFSAHLASLPSLFKTADGWAFGLTASLSLCSLAILITLIVVNFIFGAKRPPTILGLILFPISALQILISWSTTDNFPPIQQTSPLISLHILLSIIAYGLLALAFLQAILLTLQYRALKKHAQWSLLQHTPPLETTEHVLFNLLKLGLLLLTLSITTGFLFHDNLIDQKLLHKTIFSVVAWSIFSLVITAKHLRGWKGPTALKWTQGGFLLLAIGYLGSKAVIQLALT